MKKRITTLTAACLAALCLMAMPVSATSTPAAGTVATASTGLNVRSAPSYSASIVTSLPKGTIISLVAKSGSWWQVRYGSGSYGYCHADYIDELEESYAASVTVSWGKLNVRSAPSSSAKILTTLSKGAVVSVLSQSSGWSRILYNGGQTGYVDNSYLSASSSNAAVYLNVPSYKQRDTRWASVTLGSSGKTIGDIGCTTTALAMAESYRLGTTVTPADMSRRLSYTSGGSLYWPSAYSQITSGGSLSTILSLLRQGKPVIYGAKTSAGNQHWVLVNGYNGKGLSAENFTILDPGSNSRTNLKQFLSAFPVFHKLVHAK